MHEVGKSHLVYPYRLQKVCIFLQKDLVKFGQIKVLLDFFVFGIEVGENLSEKLIDFLDHVEVVYELVEEGLVVVD